MEGRRLGALRDVELINLTLGSLRNHRNTLSGLKDAFPAKSRNAQISLNGNNANRKKVFQSLTDGQADNLRKETRLI